MHSSSKVEQLNIRASAAQKSKLAEAAKLQNMNVSQFVLSKSLEAADEVIADLRIVRLSNSDMDWFRAKLEETPRAIPQLQELLNEAQ